MNLISIVREKLETGCREAIQQGFKIKPKSLISEENKTCCPMGAYLLYRAEFNIEAYYRLDKQKTLRLTTNEMLSFSDGFDEDNLAYNLNDELHKLGVEFRNKYIKE